MRTRAGQLGPPGVTVRPTLSRLPSSHSPGPAPSAGRGRGPFPEERSPAQGKEAKGERPTIPAARGPQGNHGRGDEICPDTQRAGQRANWTVHTAWAAALRDTGSPDPCRWGGGDHLPTQVWQPQRGLGIPKSSIRHLQEAATSAEGTPKLLQTKLGHGGAQQACPQEGGPPPLGPQRWPSSGPSSARAP